MKLLGIDYGSKRVGVAISDEGIQFALPVSVIPNTPELLTEILKITKGMGVTEVVMGESKNYRGEANTIMAASMEFKKSLEAHGLTVYLEPEFMTSMNARRFQGKTDLTDASAAALILQSFLDKRQNK